MALIATSAALLINNCRTNHHQESNIHRAGCISHESDRCTVLDIEGTASLADDGEVT